MVNSGGLSLSRRKRRRRKSLFDVAEKVNFIEEEKHDAKCLGCDLL